MFGVSALTAGIVARLFDRSISGILTRLVTDELSVAWKRYVQFAIYVVGISSGVRVYSLERFLEPRAPGGDRLVLDSNRWVLEIYQTVIGTLQSIAVVLLIFFLVALIAYVIVRGQEMKAGRASRDPAGG